MSPFLRLLAFFSISQSATAFAPSACSLRTPTAVFSSEEIDVDALGDWKAFRRSLVTAQPSSTSAADLQNLEVLEQQNEDLAKEYQQQVWAHEIPMVCINTAFYTLSLTISIQPEQGSLIVRLPLEVELFRNVEHSLTGQRYNQDEDDDKKDALEFYQDASSQIQSEMLEIAALASESGQLDASMLSPEHSDLLGLFLDHQEQWQEVCLVTKHSDDNDDENSECLILNRPMAFQLTQNLAQVVLYGNAGALQKKKSELTSFLLAFRDECAIYIGGPEEQNAPATLIHGYDLPGATEIAPGLYQGGLTAAIDGVLRGKYQPLDFRFFVGKHVYPQPTLRLAQVLGKVQSVAAHRSLALKQCISLPQPLWHEVLERCGGHLAEIGTMELEKKERVQFQIVDENDDDDEDDDEIEVEFDDDEEEDDDTIL